MTGTIRRVLITGANGFLGRSLVQQALTRGWFVRAVVRSSGGCDHFPNSVDCRSLDLASDASEWRDNMVSIDSVIHAAARAHVLRETESEPSRAFGSINRDGTEKIATAAAEAGVRRFVFVSSIGVNGNTSNDRCFTEMSEERPVTPYAISKQEAEVALRAIAANKGIEVVVVRPPLVFGPGVKANFLRLLGLVHSALPVPFGALSNRRSLIFVENLADLLLTCAAHPKAAGEVFLACDDTTLSTPQLWRELATRMERPARLMPVPKSLLRVLSVIAGQRHIYEQLCETLELDAGKAQRLLDWTPPVTTKEALNRTVGWYSGERPDA